MWIFLVTEVMFFGACFAAYFIYHYWHPAAFAHGSHEMDLLLGSINTVILITSSYTMVLAVHAAEHGQRQKVIGFLAATMAFGTVFLIIKSFEYHHKYVEHLIPFAGWSFAPAGELREGLQTFFNLYFIMSGLHALHVVIGLVLLAVLLRLAWANRSFGNHAILAHNIGLYWHFVDLVWVYLFPLFYLLAAE